jgi:hypothetical protein
MRTGVPRELEPVLPLALKLRWRAMDVFLVVLAPTRAASIDVCGMLAARVGGIYGVMNLPPSEEARPSEASRLPGAGAPGCGAKPPTCGEGMGARMTGPEEGTCE